MTNNIVTVNVSVTQAATPNALQKTGAFISQGGTTAAAGSRTLITALADLTDILKGALAITSLSWSGNVVTVTTAAPHGYTDGLTIPMIIAGATPSGYNGTFDATITGASTFTYPLVGDPGAETVPGTFQPESARQILAMGTTFFANGGSQGIYVLELGAGDAADGVTALTAYITANPGFFYSYLIPRQWADEATFITMCGNYNTTTSKTYFWVTMTTDNYTDFDDTMKCVFGEVESSDADTETEFSLAAAFWKSLSFNPSNTSKVTPFAFIYQYGVTAYPVAGNSALFTALKAAHVNWIGTGAEGGLSNTILFWGTTMDGKDFTYWYSVDWVQINMQLDLANAVINGSNNAINPLYYNQNGIDRLQAVCANTLGRAVTYGLALGNVVQTALDGDAFDIALDDGDFAGQAVINAIPFIPYSVANPSDYSIGKYGGFAGVYTPARGFEQIIFNLNVTDFVAQ